MQLSLACLGSSNCALYASFTCCRRSGAQREEHILCNKSGTVLWGHGAQPLPLGSPTRNQQCQRVPQRVEVLRRDEVKGGRCTSHRGLGQARGCASPYLLGQCHVANTFRLMEPLERVVGGVDEVT